MMAASSSLPPTRPSTGRSPAGLSAAWLVANVLPGSIGGRALLQRRVKACVDVEERPFRAASEAREKGTESRRDGRNVVRPRKQNPSASSLPAPEKKARTGHPAWMAASSSPPPTRSSKGRSPAGLSTAWLVPNVLPGSIGGRAPLQRSVKVWVDVEERPFRAASEAKERGTESRRDGRNAPVSKQIASAASPPALAKNARAEPPFSWRCRRDQNPGHPPTEINSDLGGD